MSSTLFTRCQRQLIHDMSSAHGLARRGLATITDVPQTQRLAVGILLNRSPIITRTPTKFEREFYKYQQRIQRALHNPFPEEFYFKKGTLLEAQFARAELARERKAFGRAFAKKYEKALNSVMKIENVGEEDEQPQPRRTEADDKRDVKSLERLLSRNLYLLVQGLPGEKYEWRFPKGYVEKGELLHEAAKRDLHDECGPHMNTWVVGRKPIGLFEYDYGSGKDSEFSGEKMFFYKAHIFAGQVQPSEKGIRNFAWLTKQEIEERVAEDYWHGTKDMLSDF